MCERMMMLKTQLISFFDGYNYISKKKQEQNLLNIEITNPYII
jgi:hypothetical protein